MSQYVWIFVDKHDTLAIERAREEDLLTAALNADLRVQYHLVPADLWKDYTDTREKLSLLRKEIAKGAPPKLTVVADVGPSTTDSTTSYQAPNGARVLSSRPTR